MSIIHKDIKQGKVIPEETLFTFNELVAERFNYIWDVLSIEHKKALMLKINDSIKRFLAKDGIKENLGIIRQKEGIKITKNLDQFKKIAEQYIEDLQTKTPLSEFYSL